MQYVPRILLPFVLSHFQELGSSCISFDQGNFEFGPWAGWYLFCIILNFWDKRAPPILHIDHECPQLGRSDRPAGEIEQLAVTKHTLQMTSNPQWSWWYKNNRGLDGTRITEIRGVYSSAYPNHNYHQRQRFVFSKKMDSQSIDNNNNKAMHNERYEYLT